MQLIHATLVSCVFLHDVGEGVTTFSWQDENGISRTLTIDTDGFCYREMPIRSGRGITIISVSRDRVRLTFSEELSRKLELDRNLMFEVALSESESQDLAKFAEWI